MIEIKVQITEDIFNLKFFSGYGVWIHTLFCIITVLWSFYTAFILPFSIDSNFFNYIFLKQFPSPSTFFPRSGASFTDTSNVFSSVLSGQRWKLHLFSWFWEINSHTYRKFLRTSSTDLLPKHGDYFLDLEKFVGGGCFHRCSPNLKDFLFVYGWLKEDYPVQVCHVARRPKSKNSIDLNVVLQQSAATMLWLQ